MSDERIVRAIVAGVMELLDWLGPAEPSEFHKDVIEEHVQRTVTAALAEGGEGAR